MRQLRRFASIQLLRGIAALLIITEHIKNQISTAFLRVHPSESPLSIFPFSAGVDVFFVISGFVMAHSSASLYGVSGAWWKFLLRRTARVAPLY